MALTLLHTADWHLGQTLRGWSRENEQAEALDRLVEIAVAEQVDALVVAGDVYDTQNPTAAAEALFYRTMTRLKAALPTLQIIVIAGNHDPAGRIEAPDALARALGIHMIGTLTRRDGHVDLDRHAIALRARDGAVAAWCLALPFLRLSDLPPRGEAEARDWYARSLADLHREALGRLRTLSGDVPLLVTGHLAVRSGAAQDREADRAILIGGFDGVPDDVFGDVPAYVALGHIHHAGGSRVRYAGSLVPLSASERRLAHGVSIVRLDRGEVVARHVPIPRPVPFLRVPETGSVPLKDLGAACRAALESVGATEATAVGSRPFAVLHVAVDGPATGIDAEIERVVAALPLRLVDRKLDRPPATAAPAARPLVALDEVRPETLFEEAFRRAHGHDPLPAHHAVFANAMATVA